MAFLFEIPIMAVLYVWCQLNKSKFPVTNISKFKRLSNVIIWNVTFLFRYASSILFRYSTTSPILAMGTLSLQYDCQGWWNDRTYRYFRRTCLLFPQIPLCPGFRWPRYFENTTGNNHFLLETHSKFNFYSIFDFSGWLNIFQINAQEYLVLEVLHHVPNHLHHLKIEAVFSDVDDVWETDNMS